MPAKSATVPAIPRPFPAHLTHASMEKMRRMVILGHSNAEIAAAFGIQTAAMTFILGSRRERWLKYHQEGRVECLPGKTVVYRKVSHMNGDVSIRPFSLPKVTMHRALLAEARA